MKKRHAAKLPTESDALRAWNSHRLRHMLLMGFLFVLGYELYRIGCSDLYAQPQTLEQRIEALPLLTESEQLEVEQHYSAIIRLLNKELTKGSQPETPPPKDGELLSKKLLTRLDELFAEIGAQRRLVDDHAKVMRDNLTDHLAMLLALGLCLVIDYRVLRRAVRALEKEGPVQEYREKCRELEIRLHEVERARRGVDQAVTARVAEVLTGHENAMQAQRREADELSRRAAEQKQAADKATAEARGFVAEASRIRGEAEKAEQRANLANQQAHKEREAALAERRTAAECQRATEVHLHELRAIAAFSGDRLAEYLLAHPTVAATFHRYAPERAAASA